MFDFDTALLLSDVYFVLPFPGIWRLNINIGFGPELQMFKTNYQISIVQYIKPYDDNKKYHNIFLRLF